MKTTTRNFWIDVALLLLLCLTVAFLVAAGSDSSTGRRFAAIHAHAFAAILLTLGSFLHVWLHRQWVKGVVTGKLKGPNRVKLFMYALAVLLLVMCFVSGHGAMESKDAVPYHLVIGALALMGLAVHVVRHLSWMVHVAGRLMAPKALPEAERATFRRAPADPSPPPRPSIGV